MTREKYSYGQLIWAVFDFENDEDNAEHPAIVLEDQGDEIAVISGTSVEPHLFQSNHSVDYSHYWLIPCNLPHMRRGLRQKTFFELGSVRGVKREKVSRSSEVLDEEHLAKLSDRTFIRAWFSGSESANEELEFGQVICCKKTNGYPSLENMFVAVIVGKMKSGKLKILKMKENNKSGNCIDLDVQEIVSDIDCKTFIAEPILIERELVQFSYGTIANAKYDSIKELPHIKAKTMKNIFNPTQEKYRLGDILCADIDNDSSSIEIPMLVIGEYDEKLLYVIKGENICNPSRNPIKLELPGFAKETYFHFKEEAYPLSKKDIKYKIKEANPNFSHALSKIPIVKILSL